MRTSLDAPPRVLVAYAGTHGHTERIARRVAEVLEHEGLDVDLLRIRPFGGRAAPARHDGVVVCASIHVGRHRVAVRRWLARHRSALNARPTALLAISLGAAEPQPVSRARAVAWIEDVRRATGWRPSATLPVAGARQAPYTSSTSGPQVAGFAHRTAAEIRATVERRLYAGARAA